MYTMWPGCYSFRDEIKLFITWFKDQADSLVLKIYEIERLMNGQIVHKLKKNNSRKYVHEAL